MITISLQLTEKTMRTLKRELLAENFMAYGRLRHDVSKLGESALTYLQSQIPVSHLARPHLRDNWKKTTKMIAGGVLLTLSQKSDIPYTIFIDQGVGPRFPKRAKALRWIGREGKPVFRPRAKGFTGVHFIDHTYYFLTANFAKFIDTSAKRYIFKKVEK